MATFATVDDLASWGGVDISTAADVRRAELLLELASDDVADAAGQTLELVDDDVAVLRGDWGSVLQLPERPVTAVDSVTLRDAAGVSVALTEGTDYVWDVLGRLTRIGVVARIPNPTVGWWGGPNATVTVVYSHGYAAGAIPTTIRRVTLAAAWRAWVNPENAVSKSFDGYGAVLAPPELTKAERRKLRKWRP